MRRFTVFLLLSVLAACVAETPQAPPWQDSCGAIALQGLVGQPETTLHGMRFSQAVRVIKPGMAVTQDYAPGRLNVHIEDTGLIGRLVCG